MSIIITELKSFKADDILCCWHTSFSISYRVWNNSSKPVMARLLRQGRWSASSCRRIMRASFMHCWKCRNGRSLSALPKGFSSSTATKLTAKVENTTTQVSMAAQTFVLTMTDTIKGVRTSCKNKKMAIICAYGNGKRVSQIFLALSTFTKPLDSVWSTRDRIGGGILSVPTSCASVISVCMKWMRHSTRLNLYLSLHCLRKSKVCESRPNKSMVSKVPFSSPESLSSSKAAPWQRLISLTKVCRNSRTSAGLVALALLENATKQLTESYHSPRIMCRSPAPSQKSDSACQVRAPSSSMSTAETAVQI
mmetsp:Transcript_79476/g.228067  ORF Transcript_79476/g.228067 Transcript_79476/m.228067 type:complete len:308 (+) Transcript_79476:407-1330(+)